MSINNQQLCNIDECRLLQGHGGNHNVYPTSIWGFMNEKDKAKLVKAGFATPRGGAKGAYQNHVVRSNRVIVPYERLKDVPLTKYLDGYVIRFYPEQYFEASGKPKSDFKTKDTPVIVGKNAFVLYRTHEIYKRLPPLKGWQICHLERDGETVKTRGRSAVDIGHYVLRISSLGNIKGIENGPPQGLFAPEYADTNTNYLSKCVLAWLTIHTLESPYTAVQATHLRLILKANGLLDSEQYEFKGVLRHGLTCCPLCLRFIKYGELHEMVSFDETVGLENAASQIEGSTRSTIVNLFHLLPLRYDSLQHIPASVAWGHAVCNTRLGQRSCLSLADLIKQGKKVGIITPGGIETFGWISNDMKMIRSPKGAVWIQLNGDMSEADETSLEGKEKSPLE